MNTQTYTEKILNAKSVKEVCKLSHQWAIETNNPEAEIYEVKKNEEGYEFFNIGGKIAVLDTYIETALMHI